MEGRHFKTAAAKRHTVDELIARYLQDVLPYKQNSTARDQARQLKWWSMQLGHCVLADVTLAHIAACRDRLACGVRANATVVRYLAAFSHIFTVAVKEWCWMEDNPVRKVRRPKEPRGRVRFLSDAERNRWLTACQQSRNLYPLVMLDLSSGARLGELLSLRWADVDLSRGTLTFEQTKNGDRRTVPLTGPALSLLRERAASTGFVFYRPNRTAWGREAWEHAVCRAKLEDFRFHDLRHSAASSLAMSGASLLEIAEILGHKTLSMVQRYAHLSDVHTRSVVARMTAAVFGE